MSFGRTKTSFNKAIQIETDKGNDEIVGSWVGGHLPF